MRTPSFFAVCILFALLTSRSCRVPIDRSTGRSLDPVQRGTQSHTRHVITRPTGDGRNHANVTPDRTRNNQHPRQWTRQVQGSKKTHIESFSCLPSSLPKRHRRTADGQCFLER
uniref:Putative secreted protein n=1 Tax=Anopheles darlingi TaxID=43151 RepID=A0A2M4D9R2_ANODA